MGAYAIVILSLVVFSVGLYQLLKLTTRRIRPLPAPPRRSERTRRGCAACGERRDYPGTAANISGAERIVVVTVIVAAILFEVWFFFFSGSSIGGSSGR
jgi:hypothetical protein